MPSEQVTPLVTVSVALPKDVADRVKESADAEQRSVSNWLRILILKALEKSS